jgi:hypothetical protein
VNARNIIVTVLAGIVAVLAVLALLLMARWSVDHLADGQTIEGCHWNRVSDAWVYDDDTLCRGTGEDPTVDSQGLPACANHRLAVLGADGRVTCIEGKDETP